jgi:hypothetical protein
MSETMFFDVSQNHPFYESVQYAKENGIVKGYGDGTFRPDKEINRAEFLKIVLLSEYNQKEIDAVRPQSVIFDDVNDSLKYWFFFYVHFAHEQGIVNGYKDGLFHPYDNISLPEALKIIFKTQNIYTGEFIGRSWYDEFMVKAEKLGFFMLTGEIPNTLQHKITRGEMVWLIHKLSINKKITLLKFEQDLKEKLTDILKTDINSFSINSTFKKEFERRKNNAAIDGDINYALSISISKKIKVGDLEFYSLNPFPSPYEVVNCTGYGYSNCINFVLNRKTSNIIFSDIDKSSMGLLHSFDNKKNIVYFSEIMGAGDSCEEGVITTYRALILENNELITKIIKEKNICSNCNCTKDEWLTSETVEYIKNVKNINATEELKQIFEFVEE